MGLRQLKLLRYDSLDHVMLLDNKLCNRKPNLLQCVLLRGSLGVPCLQMGKMSYLQAALSAA